MNTPQTDEGFDRTPQGQAMERLLRRAAPPASNAALGAAAVLARLKVRQRPAGRRIDLLRWLVPATVAAAAAAIALVVMLPEPVVAPVPQPGPALTTAAPAVSRGAPDAALVARVRGQSGTGWRIDAGLKDGLRVNDVLTGRDGVRATVVAAGIFDSRVRAEGSIARGDLLVLEAGGASRARADRLLHMGGDPGAFHDFGAVFEPMPMAEARALGLADGRAMRVVEVTPAILRDFEGEPEVSWAARLGLRAGDVVEAANGLRARDLNSLAQGLELGRRGRMALTVVRGQQRVDLEAR